LLGLWFLLLGFQAFCPPFDGYITRHIREGGSEFMLGSVINKAFFETVSKLMSYRNTVIVYAFLLLAVPFFFVWVTARILTEQDFYRLASSKKILFLTIIVLGVLTFFNLPYLSNDLYLYQIYGEMMNSLKLNPYAAVPREHFAQDQIRNVPWIDQYCAYGPLALLSFKAADFLSKDVSANFWILKIIISLPWFIVLAWVYLSKQLEEGEKVKCLALIGLNPLLLFEICQNAHLEGWVGLLFLGIIFVLKQVTKRRVVLAGVLFGLLCAIKLSVVVAVAAIMVYIAFPYRGVRPVLRKTVLLYFLFVIISLATLAVCYAPLWVGLDTFAGIRFESLKVLRSLYSIIRDYFGVGTLWIQRLNFLGIVVACISGALIYLKRLRLEEGIVLSLALQTVVGRTFFQSWYFCPLIIIVLASRLLSSQRESSTENGGTGETLSYVESVLLIASVSGLFGGYSIIYLARSVSSVVQLVSFLCMILSPFIFWRIFQVCQVMRFPTEES
jgi:hypothetical protein